MIGLGFSLVIASTTSFVKVLPAVLTPIKIVGLMALIAAEETLCRRMWMHISLLIGGEVGARGLE